jgi:hypothetical protein
MWRKRSYIARKLSDIVERRDLQAMTNQAKTTRKAATASRNTGPESRPKAVSESRPKSASESRHRGPSQPQQSEVQPSRAHSSEPKVECSEPELPPMPALKVREQSFSRSTSTSRANSEVGMGAQGVDYDHESPRESRGPARGATGRISLPTPNVSFRADPV